MAFFDRRTANILFTILAFALVLAIVYLARTVIVIFVFSILFAYLIDPIVSFLQRHSPFLKNLRGPHIVTAYLAFIGLGVLVVHKFVPGLQEHPSRFPVLISGEVNKILTGEIADELGNALGWNAAQATQVRTFLQQHQSDITGFLESLKRLASTVVPGMLVIPILAIFFLNEGENLANQIVSIVSTKSSYEATRSLANDLHLMLQHYIRAKVTLVGLSLTYCLTILVVLRFPHALALGILAASLEFVPVVGWMIAAATILLTGILTHSHWLWMVAALGGWRIVMDYLIAPRVMGRELEIHPLLAIFTLMVGGVVGGIVGIYLSIPLVAALRVIWRRLASENPLSNQIAAVASASGEGILME